MSIPDYATLMLPLLRIVADGKDLGFQEVINKLAEYFKLTELERNERQWSGKLVFDDKARWAGDYLRAARLLRSPRRGYLQITDRGKSELAKSPTAIDLKFLR